NFPSWKPCSRFHRCCDGACRVLAASEVVRKPVQIQNITESDCLTSQRQVMCRHGGKPMMLVMHPRVVRKEYISNYRADGKPMGMSGPLGTDVFRPTTNAKDGPEYGEHQSEVN